jgi:hypothetical protein
MSPITYKIDFRYYVYFVDEYSKFSWIYFLRTKVRLLLFLRSLNVTLRIFLVQELRSFERMVVQNSNLLYVIFLNLFIKYLTLTPLNKTKLWS